MRCAVMILCFMASLPVQAGILGEENISLAKMITQLEMIYTKTRDMVKEAQAQSETLTKVKDTMNTIKQEADAVRNTFLWDIDAIIKQDIERLTSLDDMGGMSLEQKLMTISDELNRRLSDPSLDNDARSRLEEAKSMLKREQMLVELEKASKVNLRGAADGVTDKEAAQIVAQSAAIQAAIAAAEARSASADQRRALHDTELMDRVPAGAANIFGAAAGAQDR